MVLGAGAAGLMCAATAGQRGRRVALLEHGGQAGRKILISGGGRCNFTNIHCGPGNFLSENPHFAKSALARIWAAGFSGAGGAVRDQVAREDAGAAFLRRVGAGDCGDAAGGVRTSSKCGRRCGTGAECARDCKWSAARGGFRVRCSAGEFGAERLVVATGGLSIPKMGATGLAYELARQFGLKVIAPRPALVPLVLGGDEAGWTELAGVSAEVVARAGGQEASGRRCW